MISPILLSGLYDLTESTIRTGVPGDIVECGVWNGGSAAVMAVAADTGRRNRQVWLFDSFEGLPPPTEHDEQPIRDHYFKGWNLGSEAKVLQVWRLLGLPGEILRIRRGWFHATFADTEIESIAVLHIDSDWYESVKVCLDTWYDRVEPGGVVILNDYNLYEGANQAVRDFMAEKKLKLDVKPLGPVGGWFRKV